MRRHSCCSIAAALALAASCTAAVAALVSVLLYPPPNLCEEGTEAPVYTAVDIDGQGTDWPGTYRLLRVTESSVPTRALPSTGDRALVLFVPGNAGAFTQVKSMCAEAAKAGLPLDFYTVDLGSELVAFRGELLERQVSFVRQALRILVVQHNHHSAHNERMTSITPPLLAVGHSMGGLVLRAALQRKVNPRSSAVLTPPVSLLLTLGTPHAAPVVATEASVVGFYTALASIEPHTVPIPVVSVSGGERDVQVPAHLSELPVRLGTRGVDLSAQAVRGVRGSVDHQCLSWCLPLIFRLNELLVTMASGQQRQQHQQHQQQQRVIGAPNLDGLVWSVPATGSLTTIQLQPGRALWREGPITLPATALSIVAGATGHTNMTHSAYRLHVLQQWLAVPQQLALQCVDTAGMFDEPDSEVGPRLFYFHSSIASPVSVDAPLWIPPTSSFTSYTNHVGTVSYLYPLHPSGWSRRSLVLTASQQTLDKSQEAIESNDVILLLDFRVPMDKRFADGEGNEMGCTIELTPDYWRAVAVLGHHQLGVVPSATAAALMMVRSGIRFGLLSAALWHICIGTIMWVHDVPLCSIIAAGGWIEVMVMLWSVTSVAITIAGMGLLCIRHLRRFLTDAAIDRHATIRMDVSIAAHARRFRKHTLVLIRLTYGVIFLMHPFEAFVLLGCVHRDASWCMSTSIALQSPKLSPSLGNVDAAACSVGLLGTSRQPTDTPSRMATVTDYRTDSTYALMILAFTIKLPGLLAKWTSSGGFYGPLQGCFGAADDVILDASWKQRYLWISATSLADTGTAAVLTWVATRAIGNTLISTSVLATWPTSSKTSYFSAWVRLVVGAAAMLGALCSGRNLYALPWTIAALLFAATHAEEATVAAVGTPPTETKQL